MLDPVALAAIAPLFAKACGSIAGDLLQKAAERHVETFFGKQLQKLAKLGKKDPAVEAAQKAYALWFEWILHNVQSLGYDVEELKVYGQAAEKLLDDQQVFSELLEPVRDSRESPDLDVLRNAWIRHDCPPLPVDEGFSWTAALKAYERQVEKQKIGDDSLREKLVAELFAESLQVQKERLGVRPEVSEARYAARMREKYQVLDLTALQSPTVDDPGPLHLQKVFLPQDVREDPPPVELPKDLLQRMLEEGEWAPGVELPEEFRDEVHARKLEQARETYRTRPRQPVLEALGEPPSSRMVILGGPGSGKSTLLRYLLLSRLDPPTNPETGEPPVWMEPLRGHFPVLIELREFIAQQDEGDYSNFLEFLDHLGSNDGYGLTSTYLAERLRNDPSLVLFDGLDEIFNPEERERIARRIAAFAGDYPRARVLVTSRPVGYPERPLRNAGFRHFALEDLGDEQVETFVHGWFRQVFPRREKERRQRIERVLEATSRSKPIRLLAGNPMLLTIMTLIAQFRELPRERWRFYDYAAEVLCHHWDTNRHLEDEGFGELLYLRVEDKKDLLRRLAWRMQSADRGLAGNFIHQEDLRREMSAFVQEREPNLSLADVNRITDVLIRQLRERNYVLCLRGPKLYGFVHRTLLEYFCAAELVRRQQDEPEFGFDGLREVFLGHWEEEAWSEALRLVCGMVGAKYACLMIDSLVDASPDWVEHGELPPHLSWAAQCLAEVGRSGETSRTSVKVLELVRQHAISKEDGLIRQEAIWILAQTWPEVEGVLELVRQRATKDDDAGVRCTALTTLAWTWPEDERVFERVRQRATKDEAEWVRVTALATLAGTWPELEGVFELVRERATTDDDAGVRGTALETLAGTWPEVEGVFELVRQRATTDDDAGVRGTALETLTGTWPEVEGVFELLRQRATTDEGEEVRGRALATLAGRWSEVEGVFELLRQRATKDDHPTVRGRALETLAGTWPEVEGVFELLRERATRDEAEWVRGTAIATLAGTWPKVEGVFELVRQRATTDGDAGVRGTALETLAGTWPESEGVFELVRERATKDDGAGLRVTTLATLARTWPEGEGVFDLVRERATKDDDEWVRRTALELLLGARDTGLGVKIAFSRDLDAGYPWLDPLEPIPEDHLKKAAEELDMPKAELRDLLAAEEEFLGWNPLEGARAMGLGPEVAEDASR